MTEVQAAITPSIDTELIYIEGWKGKDEISIYEGTTYYKVIEHRKNKENGRVAESMNTVTKADIKFLWDNIILKCDIGKTYGYRYLVRNLIKLNRMNLSEVLPTYDKFNELIRKYNHPELTEYYAEFLAELMLETFNGGRFRKAVYFPILYYPIKVLEAKGYIQYFGRGGIARLSYGDFR